MAFSLTSQVTFLYNSASEYLFLTKTRSEGLNIAQKNLEFYIQEKEYKKIRKDAKVGSFVATAATIVTACSLYYTLKNQEIDYLMIASEGIRILNYLGMRNLAKIRRESLEQAIYYHGLNDAQLKREVEAESENWWKD